MIALKLRELIEIALQSFRNTRRSLLASVLADSGRDAGGGEFGIYRVSRSGASEAAMWRSFHGALGDESAVVSFYRGRDGFEIFLVCGVHS